MSNIKQFFSIGLVDALNSESNANSFQINFNNNSLTNIQGVESKCKITPLLLTLDWDYNNISETAKNNKLVVTGSTIKNSPVTITIPDGSYNQQSLIDELLRLFKLSSANGGINWSGTGGADVAPVWVAGVVSNRIYLCWTVSNTGALGNGTGISINSYPTVNSTQYDMTKLLGRTKSAPTINQGTSPIVVTSSVPDNIQAVLSPNTMDLRTYDTIRICSNLAKRHFEKQNGVLSQTNVLLEIPVYNISIGNVLIWEAMHELFKQDCISNFDNMSIEIRDTNNNLIPLKSTCDFNMNFIIERELPEINPEDRINSLRNFNRMSNI